MKFVRCAATVTWQFQEARYNCRKVIPSRKETQKCQKLYLLAEGYKCMGERLARAEAITGEYYPDLHAVYAFIYEEQPREDIFECVVLQEATHIAEGLSLRQRTVRYLEYKDGQVHESFTGRPWTEVSQEGLVEAKERYARGDDENLWYVMRRREHDVTIAELSSLFMAQAEIGDAFFIATPYQEEVSDEAASMVLGHWPEKRRSFGWLGRKVGSERLEWTDITIDNSQVSTYAQLLKKYGAQIPEGTYSHDIPAYIVNLGNIPTEAERDARVIEISEDYYELQTGERNFVVDDQEAMEFLEAKARPLLEVLVSVQESIAQSIKKGEVEPLVRHSAAQALTRLTCLTDKERGDLERISEGRVSQGDGALFCTLIRAQRYGIWEALNRAVAGEVRLGTPSNLMATEGSSSFSQAIVLTRIVDFIYDNVNNAADRGAIMPGCAGGSSFLGQDGDEAKSSIFGGNGGEGLSSNHFEDKYGSLEFKCQKGHVNFRPPNQLIPRCKVCGISVRC